MTTNIGRDNSDASYRYKMPVLLNKIEGRGNGIKTVVPNMAEIGKALHIHPAYPLKYFGIELGSQTKWTEETERAVVNGAHTASDLSKVLDRFINFIILCPKCKLPELKHTIKSSIKIDCAACGFNETLKSSHKLLQYMIKNPPSSFRDGKSKGDDDGKDGKVTIDDITAGGEDEPKAKKKLGNKRVHKKDLKKKAVEAEEGEDDDGRADGSEEDDEEEVAEEAAKLKKDKKDKDKKDKEKKKEKEKKPSKSKESDNESDDEVWFTDTSKEAQKARQEAEFKEALDRQAAASKVQKILDSAQKDNSEASPVTVLKVFLASQPRSAADIVAELKRLQISRGFDEQTKVKVLLEALIDVKDPKAVPQQFANQSALMKYFTFDRVSTLQFIYAVADLVGVVEKSLLNFTPHILKSCYESDILEEEHILAWSEAPPESAWLVNKEVAAAVRQKADPFVNWLKNAEEDED